MLAAAGLILTALLLRTVVGGGTELGHAVSLLLHPGVGWIALALLCELVSYLAYALAQRVLVLAAGHRVGTGWLACLSVTAQALNNFLPAGYLAYALAQRVLVLAAGHRVGTGWLACLSVTAQALNNFLPAGYLAANVLNFRELRRRKLAAAQAGWVLVMSSFLYIGVLSIPVVIGAAVAGARVQGPVSVLGLCALALGLALAGALSLPGLRAHLIGIFVRLVRSVARCFPHPSGGAEARVRSFLQGLSGIRLSRRNLAGAVSLFAACWAADAGCLILSFRALGETPPWTVLPLAYCAAQLVSFLPLTPGGLGLVEGSLALGLVSHGQGGAHVLSAVLLYRVISYWGTLPAGGMGFVVLRRTRPPERGDLGVASMGWSPPRISAAPSST